MFDPVLEWFRRLRYLVNRRRFDAELQAEMDVHRAMMGEPVRFGNPRRLREEAHDAWGLRLFDETSRDVVLGVRGLRRTPGYTVAAAGLLVLALSATATTASLVSAYFLQPLPYPASDRLYHVQYAPPGPWEPAGLSGFDWSSVSDLVEHPITTRGDQMYVVSGDQGFRSSRTLFVNDGFVRGLGVRADVGRSFVEADFAESPVPAVLISRRLWQERFGSDMAAVGREFDAELGSRLGHVRRFWLAGVLPDGFWFGTDSRDLVDVLLPMRTPARTYRVVLREGIRPDVAAARLTSAVREVSTDLPANWNGVTLEAARDRYLAPVRPVLPILLTAVTLVLIIAATNLAVLTLLRAHRRQREFGVRLALGAGRARLVRMLGVEAAVLVVGSTLAALAVASLALTAIGPSIAEYLGRPAPGGSGALRLDGSVLGVTALIALAIVAFLPRAAGLTPWAESIALASHRSGRSSTDSRGARRWRAILVTAQVAASLALLVGSGLLVRSLSTMVTADYGIRAEGLTRVGVDFPANTATTPFELAALYDRVTSGFTNVTHGPVALFQWPQFAETPKQGVDVDRADAPVIDIGVVPVNNAYFTTLGIAAVRGRLITDADRPGSEPVLVVSESAAARLWPGEDALRRRLRVADHYISGDRDKEWRTVVGVVADVRQTFDDPDTADVYVPFMQAAPARYAWTYVRTTGLGPAWEGDLHRAMSSVDVRGVVNIARPLSIEVARQWAIPRFLMLLISGLAVAAVIFAALGLYGVTAFSLQQREREVAIRSALGASRGRVTRLFLVESGAILLAGLGTGLLASFAMARAVASQLHGVTPFDATTLVASALTLFGVWLAAVALPVLRVSRANPAGLLNDL